MPGARAVRRWSRVHKWSSLICTAVLLFLCVTGLPLIFNAEIDRLFDDGPPLAVMPAGTPHVSLDRVMAAAQQLHPDEKVHYFYWVQDKPDIVKLRMGPSLDTDSDDLRLLTFDARTAQPLAGNSADQGPMQTVLKLHGELLLGLPGEMFLVFIGALFVVAIVSGVVVYAPFMRKLDFGTVRFDKSQRLKWLDLHNLIGIVTLTWALVVGFTGIMNALTTPLFALWRAEIMPELLAPHRGKPPLAERESPQQALDAVRRALPSVLPISVVLPETRYATPRHYLVWTRGGTPVTSRMLTPVLVDAESGAVIEPRGLPWYLRTLQLSRPLHFGDYGEMPLKIIWALLDIATIIVLGSGLYLWLKRRRSLVEQGLREPEAGVAPLSEPSPRALL